MTFLRDQEISRDNQFHLKVLSEEDFDLHDQSQTIFARTNAITSHIPCWYLQLPFHAEKVACRQYRNLQRPATRVAERVRGRFDPTTYNNSESRLNEYGRKTGSKATCHRKRVAHANKADTSFWILSICPLWESELTCILTKDGDVGPPFRCKPLPRDFEERLTEVDEVYGIKRRYWNIFIHHLYIVTCNLDE